MSKVSGKIINPVSVVGDVISEIETPINLNVGTDMNYQASSLSTFLKTDTALFLPTDLSQIDTIFLLSKPEKYGQSIFRDRLSEKTIPINLKGNDSDNNVLETVVYSVTAGCSKCNVGDCVTYFSYTDKNGNTINDSIVALDGTKTFCSATIPIITSTSYSSGKGCITPSFVTSNVLCNPSDIEVTSNNEILYIDNGKKYQLLSSRNESNNYGWEPVSNRAKYNHIERSDFDSFDFPQVTIKGVRKIPATTADTLCGPVTYTGETYDRMNYNWFFGNNSGISFNPIQTGGTPVILSGAMESQEGVASISNREGQLLFYTNGETVYTSGNTIMVNGTGLSSSGTSTQSVVIVPKPESNKYYLFTTDYNGNPNGFEYSIVNMELQDGDGEVETKNIKLINSPLSEKVTACSHSDGESYWVVTHTSGDTNYYSYRLSSSGLTGPVTTSIGSTHNTARGYMKTSPDCSKLISVLYDEDIIDIFDFEASAGTLSNFVTLTGFTFDVGPYGLEFSSDSSKFYVSEGAGDKVYQFDLSYTSSTEIIDNVIEVANISGSSFGSLQMAPDERIYLADYDNTNLHIIHRPNGLGVQCNFEENGITLTSTTITGTSSYWGLPNAITDKSISCDRSVYLIPTTRDGYLFEVLVNNVNNVVVPKKLNYFGEVYGYDQNTQKFTTSALSKFEIPYTNLTANTGNTVYIPTVSIDEGEFIIKSYWQYDVNTLFAKQEKVTKNSIDTYKRGELYGLYAPETDWYFISIFQAQKPLFSNTVAPEPKSINSLTVLTNFTESGKTEYSVVGLSDPIVSYNGSVLAKNIEYSANTTGVTPSIKLLFTPLDNQILTYAFVTDGSTNDIFADLYNITGTISSGATGTQTETDRVFYNTTENKYEYYLTSVPVSNVLLSLNGSVLSNGIEYFPSSSDSRRIILEETLNTGDIIEAFYTPAAPIIGLVKTKSPTISWSINTAPSEKISGKFTIEFTDPTDVNFESVEYSFEANYVNGQKTYSRQVTLTNAKAGDKFIYRVKNEKFYTPIIGETIYSVSYSDVNEIEIQYNSGESY
jgi:hypothetical protein